MTPATPLVLYRGKGRKTEEQTQKIIVHTNYDSTHCHTRYGTHKVQVSSSYVSYETVYTHRGHLRAFCTLHYLRVLPAAQLHNEAKRGCRHTTRHLLRPGPQSDRGDIKARLPSQKISESAWDYTPLVHTSANCVGVSPIYPSALGCGMRSG